MILNSPVYNLPQGLRLFLNSSLQMVRAFTDIDGRRSYLFLILRGVVQGCPLAGWLFSIFLDPALRMLKTIIVHPLGAHIFATADDLAGLIPSLSDLEILFAMFQTIEKGMLLNLNSKKMALIPITASIDRETVAIFRRYLGFMIGPKGSCCVWNTPIAHWKETTALITNHNLTPNMAVAAYNSRAFPRLCYHLQLLDVPDEL
eukprot:12407248-Karenia_brevis.AAC.1